MKYKSDLFQGESKRIPAEEVWLNRVTIYLSMNCICSNKSSVFVKVCIIVSS